ncbi:hypothetical protein CYMTET_27339 [Cymbomonas tetramitiformis]|uniref:MYND-type domain-containing protein n=1 Tax=Cymbomonas tetramitiformis TaxID=36881 RepID=A0AAE0KXB5_9CHLO|nr:hypothetical protein CYMTET_27339 [Cymbomonas tetramitiformis]
MPGYNNNKKAKRPNNKKKTRPADLEGPDNSRPSSASGTSESRIHDLVSDIKQKASLMEPIPTTPTLGLSTIESLLFTDVEHSPVFVQELLKVFVPDEDGSGSRFTNQVNTIMDQVAQQAIRDGKIDELEKNFINLDLFDTPARARAWIASRKEGITWNAHECGFCCRIRKNDEPAYKLCGGCEKVRFCSEDCQAIAWRVGGHRSECNPKSAMSSTAAGGGSLNPAEHLDLDLDIEAIQSAILEGRDVYDIAMQQLRKKSAEDPAAVATLMKKMAEDRDSDHSMGKERKVIRVLLRRLQIALSDTVWTSEPSGSCEPLGITTGMRRQVEDYNDCLALFCAHDRTMKACQDAGAVPILQALVAPSLWGFNTASLALCSLAELAMCPPNRVPMLQGGVMEWALEFLELPLSPGEPAATAREIPLQTARLIAELLGEEDGIQRFMRASQAVPRIVSGMCVQRARCLMSIEQNHTAKVRICRMVMAYPWSRALFQLLRSDLGPSIIQRLGHNGFNSKALGNLGDELQDLIRADQCDAMEEETLKLVGKLMHMMRSTYA